MSELPKILLVDDRPENLLALEAILHRPDTELLKAESGRRALELLIEHEVALAIIDVQMPDMDGFQVAELMRGLERTREIPIIFVTAGLHDQARLFKGYESGAVDFLVKPLEARILFSKVEVFLQLFQQKRLLAQRIRELEVALSERERAEEALKTSQAQLQLAMRSLREADRRKNEFLAVLSHELRNPLAPIKNSLYILDRAPVGSEQGRRAKGVIDRQVTHLTNLIDDLLDVTRVVRNKINLHREPLELNELVRRAIEDSRSVFDKNEVRLETEYASHPIIVDGDRTRLAQVVGNLLQNAAKFTTRGGTTRVSVIGDGGEAVICVEDDGVGMRPETIADLFQPFMQAAQSLDRSQGGLGLGLALVKGLVELHGGTISARSDGIGRGAAFTIRLPADLGATATPREPAQRVAPPTRRRVLVIEDNIDAAESLREALELDEQAVEVAYNGPDGLTTARAFKPDVVLCDIGLPGMDGYEVARAFKSDDQLKGVYLVALSGYALPEDLERAAAAGFERHLAKPPSLEIIQRLLAEVRRPPDGPRPAEPQHALDPP